MPTDITRKRRRTTIRTAGITDGTSTYITVVTTAITTAAIMTTIPAMTGDLSDRMGIPTGARFTGQTRRIIYLFSNLSFWSIADCCKSPLIDKCWLKIKIRIEIYLKKILFKQSLLGPILQMFTSVCLKKKFYKSFTKSFQKFLVAAVCREGLYRSVRPAERV